MKKLKALLLALTLLVSGYSQANAVNFFVTRPFYTLSGGSPAYCSGVYVGFAIYIPATVPNSWGFVPDPTKSVHIISDPAEGGANSKIEVTGRFGDSYCGTGWVIIPNNPATGYPYSSSYRFMIYRPGPTLPGTNYTAQLNGFIPAP